MNRKTFLKTVLGLVAAPAVFTKVLQQPKRELLLRTTRGDKVVREVYIDPSQWWYVHDGFDWHRAVIEREF